jgi:hypothetical protein
MPSCSFSFSPLPVMLLLLLAMVLGDVAMAARPLRGIAEPMSPGAADGPAGSAAEQPGGGGGGGGGRQHDRSEAGAEVILAGFAAAVLVVVFCYIRVTRKNGRVGPDGKQERLGAF